MTRRTHALLLRGVNVGGKHRLPMAELASMVSALGGERVQTFIQSGNVVCRLSPEAAAGVAEELAGAIGARFGFSAPVVVRSAEALEAALAAYPWDVPEDQRYIAFLADQPTRERVAALDPDRSPGDRFQVIGADLHMHLPRGVADTKLTSAWMDRQLATVATGRNWRTSLAIAALLAA